MVRNNLAVTVAEALEIMRANNIEFSDRCLFAALKNNILPFGFCIPATEGKTKTAVYKLSRLQLAQWLVDFWGAEILPQGCQIVDGKVRLCQ